MGIFSSIELADIYFKGSPSDFVWKSEYEDFPNASKLTVSESQVALFYFNGACIGQLGAGIHILETENIPFLRNLLQKVSKNYSLFHAQIYFINTTVLNIKWGTQGITYEDASGAIFTFGCSGIMNLVAENPRKIVEKIVGVRVGQDLVGTRDGDSTLCQSLLTESDVQVWFRDLVCANIQNLLLKAMDGDNIRITRLYSNLHKISDSITPELFGLFEKYGFRLEEFCISNAAMPEDDPYYQRLKKIQADKVMQQDELELQQQRELKLAEIDAAKIRVNADAQQYRRKTEGISSVQEHRFGVLDTMARNEGTGSGMASDMMQIGIGMGMMENMVGVMKDRMPSFDNFNSLEKRTESSGEVPEALEKLKNAKMALDMGLITQEEYDRQKAKFLGL